MSDLISVIIPFYSNKNWLDEALESVIFQTYQNIEIIVIDDGSNEDIQDICKKYGNKIKYIRKENGGPASARNLGIDNAIGDYLAFLDSDDIWYKTKLEEQIVFMKKNNYYWSQHSYDYFNENGIINTIDTSDYKGNILPYLYTSFKVQTSCFMMKKSVFKDKMIRFDETKRYGEDAALYKQLGLRYPLGSYRKPLAKFRIRENNAGFNPYIQLKSRADTYKNDKKELYYKDKVGFMIKFANYYCFIVMRIVDKTNIKNVVLGKILYVLPWILFKTSAYKIKRKNQYE